MYTQPYLELKNCLKNKHEKELKKIDTTSITIIKSHLKKKTLR